MIILASKSTTRAKILKDFGIEFKQIDIDYNEDILNTNNPISYSWNVVNAKVKQFFDNFKAHDRVLFADSCVFCNNKILGKAKDSHEARDFLKLQSGSYCAVYTAMKFVSNAYNIDLLSVSKYKFDNFDLDDLELYLKTNQWQGKAGAMSIEGFNKKYILKSSGNYTTTMGLDIINLKAFL